MTKFSVALLACGLIAAASALPKPISRNRFFGTLIVGGEPATQGELPYQIDLRYGGSHYCGGSLVIVGDTQLVITAAHCVDSGSATSFTVTAGDLSMRDTTGREQRRQVTRIIVHEDYGVYGYENDIALLLIDQPYDLNDDVAPIPLPTQGQLTGGEILVSGWGTLSSGGSSPDILQKVAIPVVADDECADAYSGEHFEESMLCAGLAEGGKDSCQGDSGGPLRALDGGYLAGIVSWGYGCAAAGYPGVNTEVAYFVDWVNSKVESLKH